MRFRKREKVTVIPIEPPQPWMDKQFIVNDKPTNLRTIRGFAVDIAEEDYMTSTERGLALTIVALVDEICWLHAQLADVQLEVNDDRSTT
jgi:hypothetical protein